MSSLVRYAASRRSVLKAIAALPALLEARSEKHMFLALNSQLLSGRVGWPEFAKVAARAGYPGVDIMGSAVPQGPAATLKLLQDLKLRPAVLDFPVEFRKDEATYKDSLAKLEPVASFAAAIGCPRMFTYIMSSSDTPKQELRAVYKARFSECAKILARHNIRLGLEFLGPLALRKMFKHEFIWRMNDMLEFAKECGPNVGLQLDAWHWHHAGGTTQDIVAAGRERIVHVHFNDAPNLPPEQIKDNERLLPGDGVINLVGFLQALQQIGYSDALSVEVFGQLKDVPVDEAARRGLAASLKVFAKAGVAQG